MRYHGHLFSLALGIPFLSIDYTNKNGKVRNLINSLGYNDYSEEFNSYAASDAIIKFENLYQHRHEIRDFLLKKTEQLVDQLESVYIDVFGYSK